VKGIVAHRAISVALAALVTAVVLAGCGKPAPHAATPVIDPSDPWTAADLIRPAELDSMLAGPVGTRPLLLHVGFNVLYHGGAIPGSRYVGPGSKPEGIAAMEAAVRDLPRDRPIVLYCGCCPWDHCPNMRPAFRAMRGMGFTQVRAMYIRKNLDTDWAEAGFPIEKPTD
jgi:thiosulfate/3-mercaptopyruvate sulfurtransferase